MDPSFLALGATAASVACLHTLAGPDHYVPFLAMARARRWSLRRTLTVTALCGLAHVASAILIVFLAVLLGREVLSIERMDTGRGDLAAWLLLGFGTAYLLWGIRHAFRAPAHGTHLEERPARTLTGWALFVFFLLGPCEFFIPLLTSTAVWGQFGLMAFLVLVFSVFTIGTMLVCVAVGYSSLEVVTRRWPERFAWAHRYAHPITGMALVLCALSIQFGL
ncbi:MAG: hypothetical protein H6833_10140 [Planctomycetes bacterium]|nr:hypothetical protein [Planctomycetota bacterium]